MGLCEDLSSKFGLSQPQAEGAIGAIGRAAQSKLSPENFGELGKLIPGLGGMIQRAPPAGGAGGGLLGGLGGMLGGGLGEAAALAGVFKSLGIDAGKITPIAQTVLGFVRSNGSPQLQSAVNTLASKLGVG